MYETSVLLSIPQSSHLRFIASPFLTPHGHDLSQIPDRLHINVLIPEHLFPLVNIGVVLVKRVQVGDHRRRELGFL